MATKEIDYKKGEATIKLFCDYNKERNIEIFQLANFSLLITIEELENKAYFCVNLDNLKKLKEFFKQLEY